jgi:enoyl-CoA hydratase
MINVVEKDGVAVIRLEHGKANALDLELLAALSREVDAAAASDASAVVLTGRGTIFSAGVDLFRLVEGGEAYVAEFVPALVDALAKLFAFPKPMVAAVNGHAIAGGCILAAACDYRIMADGKGRIGVPELLVGVPFPAIALEIVRFATPPQHVQEIVYRGRTYEPAEALAKGLVDEVIEADRLEERATAVAAGLGAVPGAAFAAAKRQLRREALARAAAGAALDGAEVAAQWADPETHARVRSYLARTIGRST